MTQRCLIVILGLALTALSGCLPTLEDACTVDEECPADRACIGGVCAPRSEIDAGRDGLPPETPDARPDAGPATDRGLDAETDAANTPDGAIRVDGDLPDVARPDVALPGDVGPIPDAGPVGDGGCVIEPSGCNQLDDDCDGRVDEQSEAIEGCPGVVGALAMCGVDGCDYMCLPGGVPLGEDPARGCREPRTCALDGDWETVAEGFEKRDNAAQQVALAAAGDRRFVAVYDLEAGRRDSVVRSLVFTLDAPQDAVEVRLGQTVEALGGDLIGLTAVAVGERFVAGARVDGGGEVAAPIHLMARDPDDTTHLRTLRVGWPQNPALVTFAAPEPTLVTFVEAHLNREDPPLGGMVADQWPASEDGADAVEPAVVAEPRPVGREHNAAFRLGGGGLAVVGDVEGSGIDGQPRYALRIDQLGPDVGVAQSIETQLDGPVVGPISVAAGAGGFVVFAPIAADEDLLYWRTVRPDGSAFVGDPITEPWQAEPITPQALSLPGGVGVIYREDEHLRVSLPDPGFDDFAFEDRLPGAPNKIRAFAARQADARTVEIAALHERGGQGIVIFGRYVCR